MHSVCFGVKIVNPGLNLWFLCILRVLGENRESGSESVFSVYSACFRVKIVNPDLDLCFLCIRCVLG